MSTIVRLEAENVKRLRAVAIDASGKAVVTIGGFNGQGKTSVLDAIAYTLGGKDEICEVPVRVGEQGSDTLIETSDGLIVRRKWRTSKSGNVTTAVELSQRTSFGEAAVKSPQAILDSLCGKLMFDPLAFQRMKPRDQLEQLKELVGVSTDEIDGVIDQKFRERTDVNRRVKELEGQSAAAVVHSDAPASEVSVAVLMEELATADQVNRDADRLQRVADDSRANADTLASQIVELTQRLERLKSDHEKLVRDAADAESMAANAARIDVAPIKAAIANADALNRKVRENAAAKSLAERLEAAKAEAAALSKSIDTLRVDKQIMLENAAWPVPGLGFGDSGVMLNGLPFDQASSAEKLRVSVAMGFAMNPKLKVMTIRDGSLLDDDSMRMVADMAAEAGGQLWIERVGDGDECSVIIEDGEVRAREPAAELAAV